MIGQSLESESIVNLGDEYDSHVIPGGNDDVYDEETVEEEERKYERYEVDSDQYN